MKAIQCVEWGPPERLALVDLDLPEPGAGDVRVRVEAAGVNFPDALIVQKKYQVQPPLPFIPGTEVAGTVDAVGPEVKHLKAGDRVAAFVGTGGFAQFVCAPATLVAPLPDGRRERHRRGLHADLRDLAPRAVRPRGTEGRRNARGARRGRRRRTRCGGTRKDRRREGDRGRVERREARRRARARRRCVDQLRSRWICARRSRTRPVAAAST